MVAITPIFERGNAIPLTTGKVLLLQIIPYFMERKSGEFNIVILWNLDFGHDDSDDNDGDDDDDDGDDGESGEMPYHSPRGKILWNLDFGHDDSDDNDGDDDDDDDDDDGDEDEWFIWLSFMLGRQKDIMTGLLDIMMGLLGYRSCWNGRKILWRVYLVIVHVGMAERYYGGFIWFMLGWQKDIMKAEVNDELYDFKEKCEELQVIENPEKIEYPLNEFIRKYHPSGSIHFIRISNNKFDRTQRYARRRDESILAKTGRINNQNVFLWTLSEKIDEALKHCIDDTYQGRKTYISLQKDVSGEEASGRVDYEIKGKKDQTRNIKIRISNN
ncbi:hypothetical protein Glove_372g13 [Diversispora epigaea]|uniref:Uncharacterized protein n=1 Tax=Diversispora epigaea TaxID=1348612 RepID=A0A397H6A5_9GLOM|nr:hypothetical protein Glove_372g13 [Diversispora epigaea]